MTNEAYPITPPPELKQQWREQAPRYRDGGVGREHWLMDRAAQWGADEELEACYGWLVLNCYGEAASRLRDARRQKPPSLKEQALKAAHIELDPEGKNGSLIIRALEALPDD